MTRARHWTALLLAAGLVLALACGLVACGDSSDSASAPAEPPPSAVPSASSPPASSVPPAEPPPPPTPPPDTPVLESPAISASEPAPAPGEPSPPAAESPAPEPAPRSFRYDTYDLSGAVAEPGHYAFLADPADPASVVTTYEGLRDGTTTGLVIHQNDSSGASQADFYDDVDAGDVVEWREANDCFVRYPVTEVKDDPAGDPPRKLLAVKVMTYAFTGCSGTIDTTASSAITWTPANLRSPDMNVPIRHGPWQLRPNSWTGEIEPPSDRDLSDEEIKRLRNLGHTTDPAVVRQHRLWRDPTLPDGWRLSSAYTGIESADAVLAEYVDADGRLAVVIAVSEVRTLGRTMGSLTFDHAILTIETRIIDGHPAVVIYALVENQLNTTRVKIYDEATGIQYNVKGEHPTLLGNNIDGTIAIARSLYRRAP